MSVVKFPYVHYVTIICVLSPLGCRIKADTTVLVGALLILVNVGIFFILCNVPQHVFRYPASCHIDPFAPKQRDLQTTSIVKFPYVLYVTIICFLSRVGCCTKADTTVLVGALILGDRVKCIPIYLVPFESHYIRRW